MDPLELVEALFHQYQAPICTYLARLTGDTARAQELTQETFLRAFRALARGQRWDNPRAWLYRVASRLATDDYRRRRLLQWLPLFDGEQVALPSPELAAAERLAVSAALVSMSPKYRVPLVLYCTAGYSVAEVAEILGISVSAVKMRLCRAREMFREAYRPEKEQ